MEVADPGDEEIRIQVRLLMKQKEWSFHDLTKHVSEAVGRKYGTKTIQGWMNNWSSYNRSATVAKALQTLLNKMDNNSPSAPPKTPNNKEESTPAAPQSTPVKEVQESLASLSISEGAIPPTPPPSVYKKKPDSSIEEVMMEVYRVDSSKVEVGVKLGSGGYGAIYEGTFFGAEVAIKQVRMSSEKERILKEIEVMTVHHPNCAQLLGWFEKNGVVNIILRREGTLLKDYLRQASEFIFGRIPFTLIKRYALHIARGMAFLHSQGIVHRDLSPSNIMLSENGQRVVIIDFGLSNLASSQVYETQVPSAIAYRAPEVVHNKARPPLKKGFMELEHLKDLLEKCWDSNAVARPSFEDIIEEMEQLGEPKWNRTEWQERGFNFPPELDPNVLPNLYLKTMRTDGETVEYPEEGFQELVSRMLSFLCNEPKPDRLLISRVEEWTSLSKFNPEMHIEIVDNVLKRMYPVTDQRDAARSFTVHDHAAAWSELKHITSSSPGDRSLISMLNKIFRVDCFGIVVSPFAKQHSLCFYEYGHFFPHSRGGSSHTKSQKPNIASNCVVMHWAANSALSDNFVQLCNPSELVFGISAKQLIAGFKSKKGLYGHSPLKFLLGYDINEEQPPNRDYTIWSQVCSLDTAIYTMKQLQTYFSTRDRDVWLSGC